MQFPSLRLAAERGVQRSEDGVSSLEFTERNFNNYSPNQLLTKPHKNTGLYNFIAILYAAFISPTWL